MKKNNYSDNVFINCPFDKAYKPFFRALIFTILDCGFIPRCSLEIDDATQLRLSSIVSIIRQCKYGIHDLSRIKADRGTKLPRFNMPFELGIFYGAKNFGSGNQPKKNCIIFEQKHYSYQKFISDLSGTDIRAHNNSIKKLIEDVRNWLTTSSKRRTIPQSKTIFSRYLKFQKYFEKICKVRAINFDKMPFVELSRNMSDWLNINQKVSSQLFN